MKQVRTGFGSPMYVLDSGREIDPCDLDEVATTLEERREIAADIIARWVSWAEDER